MIIRYCEGPAEIGAEAVGTPISGSFRARASDGCKHILVSSNFNFTWVLKIALSRYFYQCLYFLSHVVC
jgi:hypothetical protein